MLTAHFSLDELTASEIAARRGIDNEPDDEVLEHLRLLAVGLEQVRVVLDDNPIHVTSGYRSPALNRVVGGSANSAHMRGLAADIICPAFGTPLAVCRAIMRAGLGTDQIIHEFGRWCHVAFPSPGDEARGDVLTIVSAAQGYVRGLLERV